MVISVNGPYILWILSLLIEEPKPILLIMFSFYSSFQSSCSFWLPFSFFCNGFFVIILSFLKSLHLARWCYLTAWRQGMWPSPKSMGQETLLHTASVRRGHNNFEWNYLMYTPYISNFHLLQQEYLRRCNCEWINGFPVVLCWQDINSCLFSVCILQDFHHVWKEEEKDWNIWPIQLWTQGSHWVWPTRTEIYGPATAVAQLVSRHCQQAEAHGRPFVHHTHPAGAHEGMDSVSQLPQSIFSFVEVYHHYGQMTKCLSHVFIFKYPQISYNYSSVIIMLSTYCKLQYVKRNLSSWMWDLSNIRHVRCNHKVGNFYFTLSDVC